MGIEDLAGKAKDFLGQHDQQVGDALDKGADAVKDRTDDSTDAKVDSAVDKAKEFLDRP